MNQDQKFPVFDHVNLLIFDLSYFIFFKYYAIKSWLKISKNKDNIEMNLDDEKFKQKFKSTFIDKVVNIVKKSKPDQIAFCKDCMNKDIWRLKVSDTYKNNRENKDFDFRVFQLTYDEIIPEIIEVMKNIKINRKFYNINVKIYEHESLEADDLVFILTKKMFPDKNKVVMTSDNDYLQLLDEKTELFDLKLNTLKSKSLGCHKKDLLLKILAGDPSDNISKIYTKKKSLDLINENSYETIIENHKDNESFQNNFNLICMECIPNQLIDQVIDKYSIND